MERERDQPALPGPLPGEVQRVLLAQRVSTVGEASARPGPDWHSQQPETRSPLRVCGRLPAEVLPILFLQPS